LRDWAILAGVNDTPPQNEPTFRLASMAPPRKRRPGLIAAIAGSSALVLALAAGGIGYALAGKDEPPATPAAAASGAVTTTGPITGRSACEQFANFTRGTADDAYGPDNLPALKSVAEQAAGSDSTSIAIRGQLLADTADLAIAAQGQSDEAKYLNSVKDRVRELRKTCALAGFPT
jgi:hypothetical protein